MAGRKRLRDIASEKATDYWAGSTWLYRTTVLNGAGAAELRATVVPGDDNEFEVLYASIVNLDTVTRTCTVRIDDPDGNFICALATASIAPASALSAPVVGGGAATDNTGGRRHIVSGTMSLLFRVISAAGSQDAVFAVACRVRGTIPTVTSTFSEGGSETISTNRFF